MWFKLLSQYQAYFQGLKPGLRRMKRSPVQARNSRWHVFEMHNNLAPSFCNRLKIEIYRIKKRSKPEKTVIQIGNEIIGNAIKEA